MEQWQIGFFAFVLAAAFLIGYSVGSAERKSALRYPEDYEDHEHGESPL
jgi:hypothetical protein